MTAQADDQAGTAGSRPGAARRLRRRTFLKRCVCGTLGLSAAGFGYGLLEAAWLRVRRASVAIPRLPEPFHGATVALLSDIHHGPFTGLRYIRDAVRQTNALEPDLVLLIGDYVHQHRRYIRPVFESLGALEARWGVYGVLGNHDHWHGAAESREAMAEAAIEELTNRGAWVRHGGTRLRLAGVGDLWEDRQDLDAALDDARTGDAAILLSHNPDYAESLRDQRVGLVVSGHTHGGQVVLPGYGAPLVPSQYGQKYLHGLVRAPHTQAYVTRGVGAVSPPVRFCCPPEIALLTFERPEAGG